MKITVEQCDRSQNFCDRRCGRAIREGGESACVVEQDDDGSENLTFTKIDKDGHVKVYELTPTEQKTIYETSRDLQGLEKNS